MPTCDGPTAANEPKRPGHYRGGVARLAESRKRVRLDHDERRALIFTAARRLFCTRPYSDVSMSDVADAAGVTRGLLHHYFGSKRDLYLEVVRELARVPTLPLPGDGDDGTPTWESSVDRWMSLIEANHELWLTAIGAGSAGRDAEIEAILDEAREIVAERVLQALGLDHEPVPDELRALVHGYGGLTQEVTRQWLERGRLTRDQARTLLVGAMPLLVEGLLPQVRAAGDPGGPSGA